MAMLIREERHIFLALIFAIAPLPSRYGLAFLEVTSTFLGQPLNSRSSFSYCAIDGAYVANSGKF